MSEEYRLHHCEHLWEVRLREWWAVDAGDALVWVEGNTPAEVLERLQEYRERPGILHDTRVLEMRYLEQVNYVLLKTPLPFDSILGDPEIGDVVSMTMLVKEIHPFSDGPWVTGEVGGAKLGCAARYVQIVKRKEQASV